MNKLMGIVGLNLYLRKYGKQVKLEDYSNKTIVIDISIFLYKNKYKATQMQFLRRFDYQINNFERYNITPIYIFDGPAPIEKKQTKDKRKESQKNTENPISITFEDIQKLKDLLRQREIQFYTAIGEAEKYASYLNKIGKADLCMSNDLDSLLFGCEILLTSQKDSLIEYKLSEILKELGITLNELIEIGIASGCDYHQQGIPGFGPSKALTKIKKSGEISKWGIDLNFDLIRLKELFTDFTEEEKKSVEIIKKQTNVIDLEDLEDLCSSESESEL